MKSSAYQNAGLTMIELVMTISIIAILSAVAMPSLSQFLTKARLQTDYESLVSVLLGAKTEAISRGASVMVCHTSNPTSATPSCATTGNEWTVGVIVYASGDNLTAKATYNSSNHTLIKQISMNSEAIISVNGHATNITGFGSDGRVLASQTPIFSVCHNSDETTGKLISFNAVGRMITKTPTDCDSPS